MALDHFSVTRNTTKTVLNKNGVLETVPANTPAFEFNPDGTFKGCLIEPNATNRVIHHNLQGLSTIGGINIQQTLVNDSPMENLQSREIEFVNSGSVFFRTTVGCLTNESEYSYFAFKPINLVGNCSISFSVAARPLNNVVNLNTLEYRVRKNLATGIATNDTTVPLIELSNGWYIAQSTFLPGNVDELRFGIEGGLGTIVLINTVMNVFNTTSPSSYILTTGTTATRNADVITKTGASGLIGQTEGTVFVEFNLSTAGSVFGSGIIELTPAGGAEGESNRILIFKNTNNKQIGFQIRAGGTTNIFNRVFSAPPDGLVKVAFSYKSGDSFVCVNGVGFSQTETFAFTETLNFIKLGAHLTSNIIINDHIRSVALYKRALTEAEAIKLTTL